ncbi:hypothetical protein FB107DRAFT_208632 [Schizophyllum commune]
MRISAFPVVLSLALYASARHNHFAAARNVRRDDPDASGYASQPISQGDADNGYAGLPAVANADTIMEFPLSVTDGATIPVYVSSGKDDANITRAIIVPPGKLRDNWYYFWVMDKALYQAAATYEDVDYQSIAIMAPALFNEKDIKAGAGTNTTLIFNGTTWMSGHTSIGPGSNTNVSSYDVVDDLLDYYLDKKRFPKLDKVVLAGHSAGAQFGQRYAALRKSRSHNARIAYWLANPGSLLWLTADRPLPDDNCTNVDRWKYGLTDGLPAYGAYAQKHYGRDGIVERYSSHYIHYAWGTADDGPGDTRCQAKTQGLTHYQRGLNFINMLQGLNGGKLPENQTVDWVEGVSHDGEGMTRSEQGMTRLFRNATYQRQLDGGNNGASASVSSAHGLLLGAAATLFSLSFAL